MCDTLIQFFCFYLIGVIITSIYIKINNAKKKFYQRDAPITIFLSWVVIIIVFLDILEKSSREGAIAKFFNYVDRE